MKIAALLFCFIGTSCSIPIIPRRIFSASASNELLLALSLSNAGLLPPQLQGGTVGRLIPGILQQPQIPGLAQVGFGPRGPFLGQLPNQIAFPGQGLLPQAPGQGAQQTQQAQQQDPTNPQMPQQNGQPNQVMPYMVFPQGQGQGQMMQYYPFYMYPQQQQPPQQAPQQPGQQQPTDQNTPFINQRGFVPQQAAPVVPGAQQQQQQQQMPNDPSAGGAPTTQTMPFGGVMPQFNVDRMNFANGGLMLPTTTASPDALTSSPDATGDANYMKDKANFNTFMEP